MSSSMGLSENSKRIAWEFKSSSVMKSATVNFLIFFEATAITSCSSSTNCFEWLSLLCYVLAGLNFYCKLASAGPASTKSLNLRFRLTFLVWGTTDSFGFSILEIPGLLGMVALERRVRLWFIEGWSEKFKFFVGNMSESPLDFDLVLNCCIGAFWLNFIFTYFNLT